MAGKLDLTKEYGIVLEGGGARGSYQIGAWKAMREAGIRIKGISGTSVGSLNGALICMDALEQAEYVWENISYSSVMDIDDQLAECIKKGEISSANVVEVLANVKQFIKVRGFDITPLKNLIDSIVDEDKIRNSDRELFVNTFSISDRKQLNVDVRQVPAGTIKDMLLASSYLPVFKSEKLNGKMYMDGGGFNNVPIDALLDRGYQDIIAIRIYGLGLDTVKWLKIPDEVNLYNIAPRQDLGGILEFNKKLAKKNMRLGYFDAKRLLYGLTGRWYYIDAPKSEPYYFDQLMSEILWLKPWIIEELNLSVSEEEWGYRFYTEKIFPMLAQTSKLSENWDYKELYISIIERLAKKQRIGRFQVFSIEALSQKVLSHLRSGGFSFL